MKYIYLIEVYETDVNDDGDSYRVNEIVRSFADAWGHVGRDAFGKLMDVEVYESAAEARRQYRLMFTTKSERKAAAPTIVRYQRA